VYIVCGPWFVNTLIETLYLCMITELFSLKRVLDFVINNDLVLLISIISKKKAFM